MPESLRPESENQESLHQLIHQELLDQTAEIDISNGDKLFFLMVSYTGLETQCPYNKILN